MCKQIRTQDSKLYDKTVSNAKGRNINKRLSGMCI